MPKVEVQNVYKVFGRSPSEGIELLREGASKGEILERTGNVVGLDDVSFSVEEGEIFIAMGLSGSGKSTLIRCLNRLILPSAGHVLIDGEDIIQVSDERLREIRRSKLSMVFQHFALFPHRTVVENVEYGLKVRGVPKEERRAEALTALSSVGLEGWADRAPENLSGGMRQRVGLARALVTGADILLMDEAFSALDPLIRRDMQDELLELQRTLKKTIIFITHDLHEALKLGDHIAVMKDGRIVQIGSPEEIVGSPADPYVQAFTHDVDRGRVFTVASIMQPPEALRAGADSVRTAMLRMRETGRDTLFVVDRAGQPVGMVVDADVASAVRQGATDLKGIMRTEFPKVSESTPLADVYALCATEPVIAVVDEKEQISGMLSQLDVLASLAPTSGADGESQEASAEPAPDGLTAGEEGKVQPHA
ncbi:MAG: glycine betaine/L-proline ABC transporter ATP-binding protein [Dehalococcoidia bacterium]